jgi:hypothetical protein
MTQSIARVIAAGCAGSANPPSAGAPSKRDSVERAGSSSSGSAGTMFEPRYGGAAGSSNPATTGRRITPPSAPSAPSTTYMPPPSRGITPQAAPPASAPSAPAPSALAPRAPAPPTVSAQATNQVRTTRSFFGPHDIPPENFAAYGIVAFPQKATPATIRRHQS